MESRNNETRRDQCKYLIMKTLPYLTTSLSQDTPNLRLDAWLRERHQADVRRGRLIHKSDDDDDDGLTRKERIKKVARLMQKTKELITSANNHRIEAIKHIKAMCPGIDQAETEKFIAAVRRRGRAKVIDIEKI